MFVSLSDKMADAINFGANFGASRRFWHQRRCRGDDASPSSDNAVADPSRYLHDTTG